MNRTPFITGFGRLHSAILALALSAYCILTLVYGRTLAPTDDEGVFSDAAVSLVTRGRLASGTMEEFDSNLDGVSRHIYYMPPLHFVLLAGWYKLWGVSLWATRLLSATFGLILIAAWLLVFKPIYGRYCVYFALALALDGSFILPGARGRMDMECACFGFCAIAVYLAFRERRFTLAAVAATSLIAASGLTHPNGIFYLVDFLLITVWLDRRRWSWRTAGLALSPFILGGVAWGMYIAQDPADFVKQFSANVHSMDRLTALTSPLQAIYREVTVRYAGAFGLQSLKDHPVQALKATLLITYLSSALFWIANHRFRKVAPIGPLLLAAGMNALLLALVDGQKRPYYLIHIVPPLNAAVTAWALWATTQRYRKVAVALVLGLCASVQIALHVSRIRADDYHREYVPVVAFVRAHLDNRTKLIFAPPQYGFELGFGSFLHHDRTFGYYSGKVADLIVTSQLENGNLSAVSDEEALILSHIEDIVKRRYYLAYNKSWAQVLLPRSGP